MLLYYLRNCVPVLDRFRRSPRSSTLRSLAPPCDMPNKVKGQLGACLKQTVNLLATPSAADPKSFDAQNVTVAIAILINLFITPLN